jgi:hypothetical protein
MSDANAHKQAVEDLVRLAGIVGELVAQGGLPQLLTAKALVALDKYRSGLGKLLDALEAAMPRGDRS